MNKKIKEGTWISFPNGAKDGKKIITGCLGFVTLCDKSRAKKNYKPTCMASLFSQDGVFLKKVTVVPMSEVEPIPAPDFALDIVLRELPDYELDIQYTPAIYDRRKNLIYDHTIKRDVKKEIKALQELQAVLQSLPDC